MVVQVWIAHCKASNVQQPQPMLHLHIRAAAAVL
jgi:hypothetical protein